MSAFAVNLKMLRINYGMTQAELAEKLFIAAQSVSRWEHGETEPSLDYVLKLCEIFGVSSDRLLGKGKLEFEKLKAEISGSFESECDLSERIFNVVKSIIDGRTMYIADEVVCGKEYIITDRKKLSGFYSENEKVFAAAQCENALENSKIEAISRIFTLLGKQNIIKYAYNASKCDGWYDFSSFCKTMGILDESAIDVVEILIELGVVLEKEVCVNNEKIKMYSAFLHERLKLLLVYSAAAFSKPKYPYIW